MSMLSSYTGDELIKTERVVRRRLGKFVITIALSPNNEFIDVMEVSIDKDFRSPDQKAPRKGAHDVDEFYREEAR